MRGEHEERLFPAIAAALAESRSPVREIARVVCGAGPGSFTSLRMAAAIAKGVAFGNSAVARETPLFPVSSLMLIVAAHASSHVPGRYLALLDAMRDERYAALVEVREDGRVVGLEPPNDGMIATHDTASWCDRLQARAIGPLEAIEALPHARGVEQLLADIIAGGAVSVDTWEPTYGRLAEAQVRWEAQHGRALVGDDG